MATNDTCCTLVPYFEVPKENMMAFKGLCQQFVDLSIGEKDCLFYGFSFHENTAHCREGYRHAEGILYHLDNVGDLLNEALKIAKLTRLEIHGAEDEIAKLRGPLGHLKPEFYVLEYGFRN